MFYKNMLTGKQALIDLINQGNLALHHNKLIEAESLYRQVIQLRRDIPEAHNNLGTVLKEQGKLSEAKAAFAQALKLRPSYASAHSNLLFTQHYEQGQSLTNLRKAHEHWAKQHLTKAQLKHAHLAINANQPIRVGILSPDLYYHPVGIFVLPWLVNHNRQAVELIVYHDNQRIDPLTQQMQQQATQFKSVAGMSDEDLSKLMKADALTVLIELSGHTAGNRLNMLASRVAPIQVSWIGYPSTTGVPNIDYILMDNYLTPEGYEKAFTEKLLRLDGLRFCYTPPSYAPEVTPTPALSKGYITFGSFNNLAKLTPEVIALWSNILLAVPNSRLRLKWKALGDDATKHYIQQQFIQQGIAQDRIECRGWSNHPDMLREYGDIDIALDPFPFSGGLTSCDALYMGVTMVTLAGELPISRQTASFLNAMGKNEWIASNLMEYEQIAIHLSRSIEALQYNRQFLREQMQASTLMDGKGFATEVDRNLNKMIQEHIN